MVYGVVDALERFVLLAHTAEQHTFFQNGVFNGERGADKFKHLRSLVVHL